MMHRVAQKDKASVKISTIHSFCLQVINFHKIALGKTSIRIIDDGTARKIIKNCIVKLTPAYQGNLGEMAAKHLSSEAYEAQKTISKYKARMVRAKDTDNDIYKLYQSALSEIDGVDFSDFMLYAADILSQNPNILAKYMNTYRYILVDEFQDLSESQFEILKIFFTKNSRISIVGDEDQSIYAFRGGNPALFNYFRDMTKDHGLEVQLEMNYRSTSHIIDGFTSVIKNNTDRFDKKITHARDYGEKIKLFPFSSTEDEIKYVCDQIQSLGKAKVPWGEIAILCRLRKNVLPAYITELQKRGIPCTREKQPDPGILISYMSIVANIYSEDDFYNVLNTPKRGLGTIKNYITAFSQKNKIEHKSLIEIVKEIIQKEAPEVGYQKCSPAALKGLCKFMALMDNLIKTCPKQSLQEYIHYVWEKAQLETVVTAKPPKNDESDDEMEEEDPVKAHYKTVQEVCQRFLKTEEIETGSSNGQILEFFVNYWKLSDEGESVGKVRSAVFVSSIHQSKGLEFLHVYVLRCNEGICPMTMQDVDQKEERRLFYVAISRAKEHLTITYEVGKVVKSRFLGEMNRNCFEYIQQEPITTNSVSKFSGNFGKGASSTYYNNFGSNKSFGGGSTPTFNKYGGYNRYGGEEEYKGPPLPTKVEKVKPAKSESGLFAGLFDSSPVHSKPVMSKDTVIDLSSPPKKKKMTPQKQTPKSKKGSEGFDLDDITDVIITPKKSPKKVKTGDDLLDLDLLTKPVSKPVESKKPVERVMEMSSPPQPSPVQVLIPTPNVEDSITPDSTSGRIQRKRRARNLQESPSKKTK